MHFLADFKTIRFLRLASYKSRRRNPFSFASNFFPIVRVGLGLIRKLCILRHFLTTQEDPLMLEGFQKRLYKNKMYTFERVLFSRYKIAS